MSEWPVRKTKASTAAGCGHHAVVSMFVLSFGFVGFGDSTGEAGDLLSLLRNDGSVPRKLSLVGLFQCHSFFTILGKDFPSQFDGCSGVSVHSLLVSSCL